MSIQSAVNQTLLIGASVAKIGQKQATERLNETLNNPQNFEAIQSLATGEGLKVTKQDYMPKNTGIIATNKARNLATEDINRGKEEESYMSSFISKNQEYFDKAKKSLERATQEERWKKMGGVL